ncbi:hypothetical protein PoB_004931000 [Plakobranchus ocellatus]|uniref:Uncharacterized protein n=1 Tax=Plakobranchus ocellatus TaxID=259542 RepID=A0AAV4BU31_9GAST|nr:hypothetical protein PoB_004931000 [Plakobranchus ocellatus]
MLISSAVYDQYACRVNEEVKYLRYQLIASHDQRQQGNQVENRALDLEDTGLSPARGPFQSRMRFHLKSYAKVGRGQASKQGRDGIKTTLLRMPKQNLQA